MNISEQVLKGCLPKQLRRANATTVYLRSVPRHVRDQFKAYCAQRGVSMNAMLVHLMVKVIEYRNQLEIETRKVQYHQRKREELRQKG